MKKFTLMELLIVVAIIGVLISILLPSLSQAREKAMIAVCQSNLSQLGRMCFVYLKDNHGKYPKPGGIFSGFMLWIIRRHSTLTSSIV